MQQYQPKFDPGSYENAMQMLEQKTQEEQIAKQLLAVSQDDYYSEDYGSEYPPTQDSEGQLNPTMLFQMLGQLSQGGQGQFD